MNEVAQGELPGMPQRLFIASPSKLGAWLDCPRMYRMAYLDRPKPAARPQRAHTSIGLTVHNVLRDFWDLPADRRTPQGVRELVRTSWIDSGFRDAEQSTMWRGRITGEITDYLRTTDRETQPLGIERTVALKSPTLALSGRIDRLDERGDQLAVVDYKTSRRPLHPDDARTSLALAFYAAAASRMFHRPCHTVELHHVPTGEVIRHEHTAESIARKLAEAESIARDLRKAADAYAQQGVEASQFAPNPSALCRWCDFRAHCPEGQAMGPEKSSWAALEYDETAAPMG
ncbi:RecB family exonuclease [Rudaeicoccus suwonensis]|uniref:RecB family exonuclease n=2 Tax=Rudaeicoccus suwonensis TaxID=657409 RepID=A0A561E187_9MICO|nr:RecB family exonuclease [Rudaeicoccus suwonensis]